MAAEEATKRIARDVEIYNKRAGDAEIEEAGGSDNSNIMRGTKDLMAQIQAGIAKSSGDIEDAEIEDIET